MRGRICKSILGGVLALSGLWGGCTPLSGPGKPIPTTNAASQASPPYITDTVAEYAMLVGGSDLLVRGYGLVAGLGNNGSREVPAYVREYFTQLLLKNQALNNPDGSTMISVKAILEDLDTAVVDLWGVIPAGAPTGTRFDVFVASPPETQTHSLDGGVMFLPAEMRLAVPGELAGRRSRVFAEADGVIFVNPFLDPTKREDLPKLREGRIIGGGKSLEDRPLRLSLFQADYQRADLIQRRINERFGPGHIAVAKDGSTIEITVPPAYRRDYEQFLRLLMHLPIKLTAGSLEVKAREIAEAIESSGVNHDELALVWEAIGRQVLPTVQGLYNSSNPVAAFYAARTGMRLGDSAAVPVAMAVATNRNSPLRVAAIEELGHQNLSAKVTPVLRQLLDDENESVRLAAYEALLKQGDTVKIKRVFLPKQFDMDLVESGGKPILYVSQSSQQKIVLFGKDVLIRRPIFFAAPEDLVTLSAAEGDEKLTVFRKVPRTGRSSEVFQVEPLLSDLVRLLGTLPTRGPSEEKFYGLGLTYSQVVGVLYRLCKSGDVPAEFRLQVLPDIRRIYAQGAAPLGRPDMPGQ
jgi:flagellar basal body P-ring protein FlgI